MLDIFFIIQQKILSASFNELGLIGSVTSEIEMCIKIIRASETNDFVFLVISLSPIKNNNSLHEAPQKLTG